MRRELKVLQREFGYTTIVVTHDQLEALSLADRMAVMDAGVIQQFGTPDEVFDDPANRFVADFVGEPKINLVDEWWSAPARAGCGFGSATPARCRPRPPAPTTAPRCVVGFRPQDVLSPETPGGAPRVTGELEVEVVVFENLLEFGLATVAVPGLDGTVVAQTPAERPLSRGRPAAADRAARARVYLFDSDTGERLR